MNAKDGPPESLHSFIKCAQRETFEETGISLSKHSWTKNETMDKRIQVYNQPELFYKLFPNVLNNSVIHWSNWLAPKEEKSRFHTHFFLSCLLDKDLVQFASPDGHETVSLEWMSPKEALDAYFKSKIRLMPPQYIMLLELKSLSWNDLLEYMNGSRMRSKQDLQLHRPEKIETRGDVSLFVLPGDPRHSSMHDAYIKDNSEYLERVLELTRDVHGAVLHIHYQFKLKSKLS